jgi:hypothetical protein
MSDVQILVLLLALMWAAASGQQSVSEAVMDGGGDTLGAALESAQM